MTAAPTFTVGESVYVAIEGRRVLTTVDAVNVHEHGTTYAVSFRGIDARTRRGVILRYVAEERPEALGILVATLRIPEEAPDA